MPDVTDLRPGDPEDIDGYRVITLTDCVAETSCEEHENALRYDFRMFSVPMSAADFIAELG